MGGDSLISLDFPIAHIFSLELLQLKISPPPFFFFSFSAGPSFFLFFPSLHVQQQCAVAAKVKGDGRPQSRGGEGNSRGKLFPSFAENLFRWERAAGDYSTVYYSTEKEEGRRSFLSFREKPVHVMLAPAVCLIVRAGGGRSFSAFSLSELESQSTNREWVEREERELFSFFVLQS